MIRTTLLSAGLAILLAGAPLQADEHRLPDQTAALPAAATGHVVDTLAMHPAPGVPGDVVGGRGPNPHASELRAIAIYQSVGNQTGAEMLIAELRQSGVSRQSIQRSVDQIKVHREAPVAKPTFGSLGENHADAGWRASQ
jgi:hypothetical protein